MNLSSTEENYLKTIFHLQVEANNVTTNALALKLQTSPASITDMMKKLSAKGLLHYKPYYGFSLTAEGRKAALIIIRRHRLWEYFLSEKLQFGWNEVHEVAEELEHVSSKKLIDKLDAYLGFPAFDPHGDPIPDTKGRLKKTVYISLADLPLGLPAEVKSIANQTVQMLEYLDQKNIRINTVVEIRQKFEFDGSIEIKTDQRIVTLSALLAKQLFVKKL
ncbi:MAG TPA: metal-dependent transcriptional regulator [Flavisolibacter sp.]|nr:metal-dependent transcriptional regulator [Flavisolibacter sp.]